MLFVEWCLFFVVACCLLLFVVGCGCILVYIVGWPLLVLRCECFMLSLFLLVVC